MVQCVARSVVTENKIRSSSSQNSAKDIFVNCLPYLKVYALKYTKFHNIYSSNNSVKPSNSSYIPEGQHNSYGLCSWNIMNSILILSLILIKAAVSFISHHYKTLIMNPILLYKLKFTESIGLICALQNDLSVTYPEHLMILRSLLS
jgi:hypothetical protein